MSNDCAICNRVGQNVICNTCGRRKAPLGRSISADEAGGYCESDCQGYLHDPKPDGLFPGERYGDSLGHMDWHEDALP